MKNYKALFELSPALCVVVSPDLDFTILAASDAYLRATLTQRELIVGKRLFDIFPDNPDDPEATGTGNIGASLERVLKSRTPDRLDIQKYDVPRPAESGGGFEEKYWSPQHIPILDENGKLEAIMQHVEDVTDIVRLKLQGVKQDKIIQGFAQARRSIENERTNFRNLFKQTPEIVCITKGPHHVFEFVNDAHIKVIGFDATGMTVREAQPESIEVHGILDDVYQTGKTAELVEIPVTLVDKIRYFNLTYAARRDEAGFVNGIMILGTEITESVLLREGLKASQEKLEKAIRARDEFLSIASHELKTPLTSMKIHTQMFFRSMSRHKQETAKPYDVSRMVTTVDHGLNRLIRLVEDMLDISRIQTGRLTFEFEQVRLDKLMEEFFDHSLPDLTNAGIELKTDLAPELTVAIDKLRLEQVLTNLTSNAIRYAPRAPLHVKLERRNDHAVISFKDHGSGIPVGELEKVFIQYERLVTPNEVSGLGLGLYICKKIVEGHGGTIRVINDGGSGALFEIQLPLDRS